MLFNPYGILYISLIHIRRNWSWKKAKQRDSDGLLSKKIKRVPWYDRAENKWRANSEGVKRPTEWTNNESGSFSPGSNVQSQHRPGLIHNQMPRRKRKVRSPRLYWSPVPPPLQRRLHVPKHRLEAFVHGRRILKKKKRGRQRSSKKGEIFNHLLEKVYWAGLRPLSSLNCPSALQGGSLGAVTGGTEGPRWEKCRGEGREGKRGIRQKREGGGGEGGCKKNKKILSKNDLGGMLAAWLLRVTELASRRFPTIQLCSAVCAKRQSAEESERRRGENGGRMSDAYKNWTSG